MNKLQKRWQVKLPLRVGKHVAAYVELPAGAPAMVNMFKSMNNMRSNYSPSLPL